MDAGSRQPQIGVSVLVRKQGQVLLVKRGRPPLAGLWSLPGGRVEFGERLEAAAIREIREETGIAVADLVRIDMAEIIGQNAAASVETHFVLIVFAGRYVDGDIAAGDDAAEARWVGRSELAGLDMTEDTRRVIEAHGIAP